MYSYLMWTLFSLIEHLRKKRKPSVYRTCYTDVRSPFTKSCPCLHERGGGGGAEVDYYL